MEAIILAGGFGTRLRQIVPDLPKPMSPVAGKPFLEFLLSSLDKKGFDRVVLSLGYMADKITGYFGKEFNGIELIYEIENVPLGTGGATRQAMKHCKADHVYVFNGDTYFDVPIHKIELVWKERKLPIIIAQQLSDTHRYGRVEIHHGYVQRFTEKGISGPGLINAGCYVFPTDIFNSSELKNPFSLESDFLVHAIHNQRFYAFITDGYFVDIGMPDDFMRAQTELPGRYK